MPLPRPLNNPPHVTVQSTPSELRVSARLGYETVEPTLMTSLVMWTLVSFVLILAFVSSERDIPRWFDSAYLISMGVMALVFLAANFLNRAYLVVDAQGITTSVRPIPVGGFRLRRRLSRESIAGIYVAQSDLVVRLRPGLFRSYEVHALTTGGYPVCLVQRLPDARAAEELAANIRTRLCPLPEEHTALRGGIRSASEFSTEMAGFFRPSAFWILLLLGGLQIFAIPLVSIAGLKRVRAEVTQIGDLYHARRSCMVRFEAPGGTVFTRVQNRCGRDTNPGDLVTVFYNPRRPAVARALIIPMWPVGVLLSVLGGAALIALRPRPKLAAGAVLLWEDDFKQVGRYWNLDPKNATASKGILTLSGLSGACVLPNGENAFEPAALEVNVGTGELMAEGEGAGLVFAAREGAGYVFGFLPQQQCTFARQLHIAGAMDLMPPTYVREIKSGPGQWNALRVTFDGSRAAFTVNGARAGAIDFNPPLGGGLAGIYADFNGGRSLWQFTGFRVFAGKPSEPNP